MIKCENLIKENHNVYMIDSDNVKLDLEDNSKIQRYEKTNKINIIDVVNNFLMSQDEYFDKIISNIEELVRTYNIDYFMYGEGKQVGDHNLALMYNLKNRSSCIDCNLKIYYSDGTYAHEDKVKYMIEFSEGASGDNYGFSFYKYFKYNNFNVIKDVLEKYFSSGEKGIEDRKLINECIGNIKNRLEYYYSE